MGLPDTPSETPHQYPQAIQLKLYQAFIFSIPILFSIILFLLFYLFYIKRRASILSSPPILPTSSDQATPPYIHSFVEDIGCKGKKINQRLPTILFEEEIGTRDSQCCVCLGEFEIKEQLLQVPSCKHVFHIECIHQWLHSNNTCPLCRCSLTPVTNNLYYPTAASVVTRTSQDNGRSSNQDQQITSFVQQQEQQEGGSSSVSDVCTEQLSDITHIEGSSSSNSTRLSSCGRLPDIV